MDPDDLQDTSKPFLGVVVCCTSIPPDQRKEIATRTTDMGGVHKYDLTPDVTHLIVGDYNTPKYRHVAKERPDIAPMAAGWIDDARDHWTHDRDFDFAALEAKWRLQTFESSGGIPSAPQDGQSESPVARRRLLCCLTGFEDADVRAMIEDKVKAHGGEYTGDLSRRVTHLIAAKPEGKKFRAASSWGIYAVSIEWLHDSIERGMILQEDLYSPTIPQAERGQGAWVREHTRVSSVSLGKRLRDGQPEESKRKLRKTASLKLNQQRDNLWGDILVKPSSAKPPQAPIQPDNPQNPAAVTVVDSLASVPDAHNAAAQTANAQPHAGAGVFSTCQFYIHGFAGQRRAIVEQHLQSHGGLVSSSLEQIASQTTPGDPEWRFLIVPQTSQPDSHPHLPDGVKIVTEFYLERCIHNKRLYHPAEHALGQPFAMFPIPEFKDLVVCSAGFQNEQLNQVEKAVTQLGAVYSENLNARVSLLVCPSIESVRKQKLEIAIKIKVPIVDAEWLWECIRTGCCVPQERYLYRGLASKAQARDVQLKAAEKHALQRSRSEPSLPRSEVSDDRTAPPTTSGVDRTAFQVEGDAQPTKPRQPDTATGSNYKTARSHLTELDGFDSTSAPLGEISHNAPKKSPPEQQCKLNTATASEQPSRKLKRFPTDGEIGDSEAGEDSDASISRNSTAEPATASLEGVKETELRWKHEQEKQIISRRLQSIISNEVGANDKAASENPDCAAPAHQSHQKPIRRKRAVLGRAISGASSASTESHITTGANPGAKHDDSNASGEAPGDALSKMLEKTGGQRDHGAIDDDGATPSPPPTTQIGYNDPAAAKHRKSVETRLQGLSPNQGNTSDHEARQKVTVATFSGGGRKTRSG